VVLEVSEGEVTDFCGDVAGCVDVGVEVGDVAGWGVSRVDASEFLWEEVAGELVGGGVQCHVCHLCSVADV